MRGLKGGASQNFEGLLLTYCMHRLQVELQFADMNAAVPESKVEEEVACMSQLVKNMVEDSGAPSISVSRLLVVSCMKISVWPCLANVILSIRRH